MLLLLLVWIKVNNNSNKRLLIEIKLYQKRGKEK